MTLHSSRDEGAKFLRSCLRSDEWTALLLKNNDTGAAVQRVGSLSWACSARVQSWLRERNAGGCSVFAAINVLGEGARSRGRADVAAVRHVFVDVDRDARTALARAEAGRAVPPPTYVVHTSPNRVHLLWRVRDFDAFIVELVQRRLAVELGGDSAATSIAQMTRLPGFWNHKYDKPHMVVVDYRDVENVYTPRDFASAGDRNRSLPERVVIARPILIGRRPAERARAYLARVPPAVEGGHGDMHTFQICCRVVRGFALDDDEAFAVLVEWNARCQPPWTERELLQKIRSARRNGREPIGGLL